VNLFRGIENKRVLLVEDDRIIRQTLLAAFELAGSPAKAVYLAEEGLAAFQNDHYSVVISDFKLSGLDGLTFLRKIHSLAANTIRILISGYADNQMVSEAGKVHIDAFLEKPFTFAMLFSVLNEIIKRRRESAGSEDVMPGHFKSAPNEKEQSIEKEGGRHE
jgi:two-component system C4-dicarboxylate transport response regulator DctD